MNGPQEKPTDGFGENIAGVTKRAWGLFAGAEVIELAKCFKK